jgi:hypothetical protein
MPGFALLGVLASVFSDGESAPADPVSEDGLRVTGGDHRLSARRGCHRLFI